MHSAYKFDFVSLFLEKIPQQDDANRQRKTHATLY